MTSLMLAAWLTVAAQTPDTELKRGAALFKLRCAVCHGENGRGDGVTASALKPPPADFTQARYDAAYLSQVLFSGVPGTAMPAQQDLSAQDKAALQKFVQSLAPPAPAPVAAAALATGRAIFEIRCAACHGQHADGAGVSRARFTRPPADFTRKQPTRERILKVMHEGIAGTAMTPMRRLVSDKELDALVLFLQSRFGTGSEAGVPPHDARP